MAYFFRIPFATAGDKTAVPEASQPSGAVSYTDGFTVPYQEDPGDPGVRYPERDVVNDLFNVVTDALNQYQTHGFPDFITTSDNNGSPYPYDQWAFVRYSGVVYYSLVGTNTALPTDDTKWAPFSSFTVPTGTVWEFHGATLPSGGWLWANGQTVGNATSNATGRANADTLALFMQIWTDFPNSIRPILTSAGAASSRGASALADFNANKQLPISDKRCVVSIGRDAMGGAGTLGLITDGGCGITGTVLGVSGGAQNVVLDNSQLPNVSIGIAIPDHTHFTVANVTGSSGGGYPPDNVRSMAKSASGNSIGTNFNYQLESINGASVPSISPTNPAGGGSASGSTGGGGNQHLNVQPSLVVNFIIKL